MTGQTKENSIKEAQLYTLWQQLCLARLTTSDKRLTGIFAGQLNTACGPDYRGAEFDLDGRRFRGDVEIHRELKDWFRHGHHLDWRYDNVQLHLVADPSQTDDKEVTTSKGLPVPTLDFVGFPVSVFEDGGSYNCSSLQQDIIGLEIKLKHLAQQRLRERINLFYRSALGDGLDQAFYRLIFRQLGRGQNADLFERLAFMLPWSSVQQIKKRYHFGLDQWRQLLLQFAGLGERNAKIIPSISGLTDQSCIPGHIWQRSGHRPAAHPEQRLKGMAQFISGLQGACLYEIFLEQGVKRSSFTKINRIYTKILHPDSSNHINSCWGRSLVLELIGNVVIPALYYHAELSASEGFKSYIEQYYFWLPATINYSCLKRYRNWPELSVIKNQFYVSQSLLWLQQNYCQPALCHLCPLGRIAERV